MLNWILNSAAATVKHVQQTPVMTSCIVDHKDHDILCTLVAMFAAFAAFAEVVAASAADELMEEDLADSVLAYHFSDYFQHSCDSTDC